MDERTILYKLNKIKMDNELNHLKNELTIYKNEIDSNKKSFHGAVKQYDSAVKESISQLERRIVDLEKENELLNNENITYKEMLRKIPRFIVRLFNKNYLKQLGEGENNGKK